MRIYGPNGVSTAPATAPKRTASSTFSLDAGQESRPVSGNTAPRSIGGLETLMALQAFEEPTERRRRAIKRPPGRRRAGATEIGRRRARRTVGRAWSR